MKKILLLSSFALLYSNVQAQFYAQGRNGYSWSVAVERSRGVKDVTPFAEPKDDGERLYNFSEAGKNYIQNTYGTGGEGFTSGVGVGYYFNKNVGVEMGISYFQSKISLAQETRLEGGSFRATLLFYARSQQLRVLPSLVIRGSDKGVQPYARMGLVVPVMGEVRINNILENDATYHATTFEDTDTKERFQNDIVFNGAPSWGYNSAFGINIPIEPHLSLCVEAELITLGIKAGRSKVVGSSSVTTSKKTGAILSEQNDLETGFPTVADRETEYVEQITSESNVENKPGFDHDKPKNEITRITSYNSLGAHLTLRYTFGKKSN
jgi:Outer membrane protein beta-barrel domain